MGVICATVHFFGLRRQNRIRDDKYGAIVESSTTQPRSYASGEDEERMISREDIDSDEYKARWGLEGMSRSEIVDLGDDHPAHRFIL